MVQLLKHFAFLQTLYSNMTLPSHTEALSNSLSKAGLAFGSTPLIPADFKPTTELVVKYGDKPVDLGNYLKTGETKDAPTIEFKHEVYIERHRSERK